MFPAVPYSPYIIGSLRWYSVLIVGAIILAMMLCGREEKRLRLPEDTVLDISLLALPLGIIGARLYYVLFQWEYFARDPLAILRIWEGGLAIYGGIIGGAVSVLIIARVKKVNPLTLMDMIVPTVALAQAIGRWGNYFNMEAYGPVITNPAWQFFPAGVLIPDDTGAHAWHMATFFYESMWNLMVFAVLWFVIRKRKQHEGVIVLWYALLYGAGRSIIEGLRTDSLLISGLRVSQVLSLGLSVAAAVILLVIHLRNQRNREA